MRCWDSRLIDQKTRWLTSIADLRSLSALRADETLRELTATVTSISGPPDGRLTKPLASDTPDGATRCWESRLIDERTRWSAYVGDLLHPRGAADT